MPDLQTDRQPRVAIKAANELEGVPKLSVRAPDRFVPRLGRRNSQVVLTKAPIVPGARTEILVTNLERELWRTAIAKGDGVSQCVQAVISCPPTRTFDPRDALVLNRMFHCGFWLLWRALVIPLFSPSTKTSV